MHPKANIRRKKSKRKNTFMQAKGSFICRRKLTNLYLRNRNLVRKLRMKNKTKFVFLRKNKEK